jgi:squalene-hopene/tetraprenyl-beta-curcumene cyclase
LIAAAALMLLPLSASRGEESAAAQVRATVAKSLPFIEREGVAWMEGKKCQSCHQTSFMVWSLNRSAASGLPVESAKLAEWNVWAIDWQHMAAKEKLAAGEKSILCGSSDTVSQLLLGRATAGSDGEPAWVATFAECLAACQNADGSWNAGGQLPSQKRPKRETQEVSTMWAILALCSVKDDAGAFTPKIAQAREWLGSETVGRSSEWWATSLLVERAIGDSAKANGLRKSLLEKQHADGGWGWLVDDESDALGTGIVLYALSRDGIEPTDPGVAKARAFLAQTQREDGSWAVKGTKENKKNNVENTSVFWGTCWAAIGLLESLPADTAAPAAAAATSPAGSSTTK